MQRKQVLILGAGVAGKMVLHEITRNSKISASYSVVGFLDDDSAKKDTGDFPLLGALADVKRVVAEHRVDEIIIAIPSAKKEVINRIVLLLSGIDVTVKIVPGIFEIVEGSVSFNQIRSIDPLDLLGREEVGFDREALAPYYKEKTVLVTGGGGSIGAEIVAQLLTLPVKRVIALGHGENSIFTLALRLDKNPRFSFVIADIRDKTKIAHVFRTWQPDIVFHAAAHKHVPLMEEFPDEAVKNNVLATAVCAECAVALGITQFVLVSTDKAVNPTSVMGATKRVAERIISSLNAETEETRLSVTRFGNVLGSRGSVIPIFKEQIERGGPVTVTHEDVTRFFMSIREAARLVIKSATLDEGHIYVLDMGRQIKILDLVKNMIRLYGYDEGDIPVVFTGLRKGEKLYEEVLTEREHVRASRYDKLFISGEAETPLRANERDILIMRFRDIAETCDGERIRALLKEYVKEYTGGE